jgi:hypothetical protein
MVIFLLFEVMSLAIYEPIPLFFGILPPIRGYG